MAGAYGKDRGGGLMDALDQAVDILASLRFGEDEETEQRDTETWPALQDIDYDEIGDPREKW